MDFSRIGKTVCSRPRTWRTRRNCKRSAIHLREYTKNRSFTLLSLIYIIFVGSKNDSKQTEVHWGYHHMDQSRRGFVQVPSIVIPWRWRYECKFFISFLYWLSAYLSNYIFLSLDYSKWGRQNEIQYRSLLKTFHDSFEMAKSRKKMDRWFLFGAQRRTDWIRYQCFLKVSFHLLPLT